MALDLNDKTVNGNDLTNGGSAAEYTADTPFAQSASAVDLPSNYLYIDDASQTGLDLASNFTIELWVKFDTLPASGEFYYFVAKWNTTGNQRGYAFGLENSGGTLRLSLGVSDNGTNESFANSNWTPSTGVWYHVAVRYNTSGSTNAQFYVDGSTQGADHDVADYTPFNNTAQLFIGTRTGYTPTADYKADDIRVWNTARTGTQINDNKSIELTGGESGLVAYWPFESIASQSASASASPSQSPSASQSPSPSLSPSASLSGSPSASASSSQSPSGSESRSQSPSSSLSPSSSASSSGSSSVSASESQSASSSHSPSPSPSVSPSASASPSPAEYTNKYSTVGNSYTDKYTVFGSN